MHAGSQVMVIKQGKEEKVQKEVTSRPDYESALETLKRFGEMVGGKLVQPSGIVRRSGRGQWRSRPALRLRGSSYSPGGHGRAK